MDMTDLQVWRVGGGVWISSQLHQPSSRSSLAWRPRKSWPRHLFAATDFSGEGNMAPGHSAVYLECTYVWFPLKSRVYL